MSKQSKCEQLILLIRQIAREEALENIDEHLNDYEHTEKSPAEVDFQGA